MEKENNTAQSTFRYLTVFYLVLILYCSILAFLAYPKVKQYLEKGDIQQHYELWKTKESNLQETSVPIMLHTFTGNAVAERCIATAKKDQLHYILEALLLPISEEELQKGYISLIPSGTKLLGCAESDGYFFIRLSKEFLTSDDTEDALRQIKETLNLYYEAESLTVICGEGGERLTI